MKLIKAEDLDAFMRKCINKETAVEAGYVNDPSDLGKETNHGITIATANKYITALKRGFGWDGKMINLTTDMAYFVYEHEFWSPMQLNQIAAKYGDDLAYVMFRWGLKSGSSRPVEALQRTLNVMNNGGAIYPNIIADGVIGKKTFAALAALCEHRGRDKAVTVLTHTVQAMQISWMVHISEARAGEVNERYTWGWVVRCLNESSEYIENSGVPRV